MHESRRPRRKPTATHARGRNMLKGPPRDQFLLRVFVAYSEHYVGVVGLTELQPTAQDKGYNYVRENLEKR